MKAERATAGKLPEYENPPVTEVVCGTLFKTLENFRLPHFGLLWKLIEKDYPACQEVAPLLPIIERYGTDEEQQQLQVAFGDIPLPRIWFLDAKGTGILQLQRDRLLHNWKKNKATDAYLGSNDLFDSLYLLNRLDFLISSTVRSTKPKFPKLSARNAANGSDNRQSAVGTASRASRRAGEQ